MAHTLAIDTSMVALDLHALLRDIDAARWRADLAHAARERLVTIQGQLHTLLEQSWPSGPVGTVQQALQDLAQLLADAMPTDDSLEQWVALRAQLQPAYEALAARLSDAEIHVPSLRPTNYTRNVFHLLMGIGVVLLVEYVLTTPARMIGLSGAGLVWAISMETTRRYFPGINGMLMWVFGRVAHPHETHRVNSASWYTLALFVLALTVRPMIGVVAVIVLAAADPAAATIGRRWGRIKLIHGRTLEGTLSFVVVGTLAALAVLGIWHPEVPWPANLAIAAGGATIGAIGELFAKRIDDNLSVPVTAAFGAAFAAALFGV